MLKSFVTILIYLLIFAITSCSKSEDKKQKKLLDIRSIGGEKTTAKEVKKIKPNESYYRLDELKFFGLIEGDNQVYVKILVSLAYPKGNHDTEKEIILRRDQISEIIVDVIASKSFSELIKADKREKLKGELVDRINQIMAFPISDLYYIKFQYTLQPKQ
ncbi:MAG: flagellar basal body-associated FliL family protein [Spirochaetota bacterium]|nr:flagellar basal body-associated FliL family protein [Spirochaetota bacterium]